MSYSLEVLQDFIKEFSAKVIEPLPKLRKEARIPFTCRCGTVTDKSFVRLKVSGMLCPNCTAISRRKKREETNLERYGTTCTLQNEIIDAKAKETLREHFGVDNPFKSEEMQKRICQTNLKKYGAENPYASPQIIEKIRTKCLEKYGTAFPTQTAEVQNKIIATNLQKYGVPVSSQAQSVKEKAIKTNMEKYGMPHHIIPEILEKGKITNMARYGVPYSFQAESVKKKITETVQKRYGVKYILQSEIFKEKVKQTNLRKLGYIYCLKSPIIRAKIRNTCLQRYGVESPLQSTEIQAKIQKSGFKYKYYITPKNHIRKVQGFEPYALDILLKEQHLAERDVITSRKRVPRIEYIHNGKKRYYFPDIFIKSQNKIIEVKSTWTYKLHYETNTLKCRATVAAGYDFEFWIFTKEGELEIKTATTI